MSRTGKVAVIGAGFYGSTTAQRLAEYDIFDEVVLTDIVEGKPEGLALDMNQARPVEGFETKVTGQTTGPNGEGYEAIAGAGIVVITAGLPRKPGMSRMDLIEVNAKIVRNVVENVIKHAPQAVLIVVSNPLDEMTALAAKVSGFPPRRVLGQAGMSDDEIEALVSRTRNGGGEIVALLKTGSAYYAPSAAAARMARAVAEDSGAVMPVCAWVDGEYGISGVYLGVEAEIGAVGVRRIVERDLSESELAALREAAEAVRAKQADVASL
jgi:malate dehydrogenase